MALKSESSIPDEVRAKAAHAKGKMKIKVYEKELHKLQVELCRLQDWVKEMGERIIILFEGRDAEHGAIVPEHRAVRWKPTSTHGSSDNAFGIYDGRADRKNHSLDRAGSCGRAWQISAV